MARRPKGSIVQPLPSWNLRNMAGAAGDTGALGIGTIGAVGLYNDAQRGEWLVIWDVQVFAYPYNPGVNVTVLDCTIMHGYNQTVGLAEPNSPLCSAAGSLPGFVWKDRPLGESGALFFSGSLPQNGYQWPHDWPFCAIQPGDSCTFYTDANATTDFAVNFIYEVVPGGI